MTTIIIISLLIAVLGLFSWKMFGAQSPAVPKPDAYICPDCNHRHCDCRKENDS